MTVLRLFETDFKLGFFFLLLLLFKFSVPSMKANYKTKASSHAFNEAPY